MSTVKTGFTIKSFSKDTLNLSDIQLASDIQPSDRASQFVKNGYQIVPLPSLTINRKKPIFAYFEIYNLSLDSSGKSNYQIDYEVSPQIKKWLKNNFPKEVKSESARECIATVVSPDKKGGNPLTKK